MSVLGIVGLIAVALMILSNLARLWLLVRRLAQSPEFSGREAHR